MKISFFFFFFYNIMSDSTGTFHRICGEDLSDSYRMLHQNAWIGKWLPSCESFAHSISSKMLIHSGSKHELVTESFIHWIIHYKNLFYIFFFLLQFLNSPNTAQMKSKNINKVSDIIYYFLLFFYFYFVLHYYVTKSTPTWVYIKMNSA